MTPNLLFSSLFLSSILRITLSADPTPKMDCFPKSCGNVTNISYPFWIRNQQPNYCGFQSFALTCRNEIPVLHMASEDYQLKNIFYENQSLVVADDKWVTDDCPTPNFNLSFSLTPFSISSANQEILLFFKCSKTLPQYVDDYYRIPCSGEETYAYLGGGYEAPEHFSSRGTCETDVMPVLGSLGENISQYLAILKNGFLLEWTVANCSECVESKGQCGYSYDADSFICICPDRVHSRSCKNDSRKKKIIVAGVIAGAAFIAAFCLGLFWYKRRKRQQGSASSTLLYRNTSSELSSRKDPELGGTNYMTHIFSYDELQEATNCFDASKELGDGGFGTVYKGKLRDGRTVAVKRLYESNYKRVEQFMNEVDILSRLRHLNLVTLYGCTSRHSRELLLVYEYVPNGTVADHLHGPRTPDGGLTWPVRLSIAIETADALAYLHAVEPQIIHRDVKTNNILLDNSFHVKVADFGLSRLFPLDATHVSTAPQGTPGYVDPEYHQCYQLTEKSDVYSFGVVLVELISSMPAVDISRHRHEINLANLAVSKIQNQELDQLVDPVLGYHSDSEMKRMITQVAELAFRCLQLDSEIRPSIKDVLEELRGIESGEGRKAEKSEEADVDVPTMEESRLLKNFPPFSPDSVAERWDSLSTTPNTSTFEFPTS